ncbi:hypothetical protein DPMN_054739 [Dreissena polymorpha]|uniref:Uncharacterized protein n=1 Tax=Dreissena polymorpha TaxID=45954 RepID=A0A9D4CNN2_DREPO|nr:hypothetical protein DPMN_054739 [Dreissena polymorpha]
MSHTTISPRWRSSRKHQTLHVYVCDSVETRLRLPLWSTDKVVSTSTVTGTVCGTDRYPVTGSVIT